MSADKDMDKWAIRSRWGISCVPERGTSEDEAIEEYLSVPEQVYTEPAPEGVSEYLEALAKTVKDPSFDHSEIAFISGDPVVSFADDPPPMTCTYTDVLNPCSSCGCVVVGEAAKADPVLCEGCSDGR